MVKSCVRKPASRATEPAITPAPAPQKARRATWASSGCRRKPDQRPMIAANPARAKAARRAPAPSSASSTGSGRGDRREAGRALGEERPGVKDAVGAHPAFDHDLDARPEDVGQLALEVDRHVDALLGCREVDLEAAVQALHVVLDGAEHPGVGAARVALHLGDGPVVLGLRAGRAVNEVADAAGHDPDKDHPPNHAGAMASRAASVADGSLSGTVKAIATSLTPIFSSACRRSRHSCAGPTKATRSTISSLTSAIASSLRRSR